jgi:hypothetical protein
MAAQDEMTLLMITIPLMLVAIAAVVAPLVILSVREHRAAVARAAATAAAGAVWVPFPGGDASLATEAPDAA